MTTPNKTVAVSTGAEAFLAQMRALGSVRYMFANTGTDHGPLIEAMARTAGEDPRDIRPIVVPHESGGGVDGAWLLQCDTTSRRWCWCTRCLARPMRWAAVINAASVQRAAVSLRRADADHRRRAARRQEPKHSLAPGVARSRQHRARVRQVGLRNSHQSKSRRGGVARLQDRHERAARSRCT